VKRPELGIVIATRTLELAGKPPVSVEIGKPGPFPDGIGCYCPYRVTGLGYDLVRYAAGEDTVQALQLVMVHIGVTLQTSPEAEAGTLSWACAPGARHMGFPVADVARDLIPSP
jgi:hypothetical protein